MSEYQILNGDCLEVIKSLDVKVDLILTDPPYIHEGSGGNGMLKCNALERNGFNMKTLGDFKQESIYKFLNVTKPLMDKPQWFVFCSEKQIPYYTTWALENKFKFNILVWCKPCAVTNRERFSTNLEYIIRIYTKGCALNKLDLQQYPEKSKYYSKWKDTKRVSGKKKLHPSEKPIELLKEILELTTIEGDTILDCYMGSCTSGIACKELNRRYIGIELNEQYYKIAVDRISGYIHID